ncbi:putative toxin-antitoxin system toxin component, PIN family [Methylomagnum sp.]
MRLLIDTNVLLSGILWKGAPHHLLAKIRDGEATLITCADLIEELAEVIARPTFSAILTRSNLTAENIVHDINLLAEIVVPIPLANPACRDPDDDIVLATALTGQVDLIVSGDADLLDLRQFQLIPIVGAAEAIHRLSV